MIAGKGWVPATFDPRCLASLDFADDTDEMRSGEVADLLGASTTAVVRWCASGELKARKDPDSRGGTGGILLITVADLRAFVAARSRGSDVA